MIYHLSEENHNNEIWKPRIPKYVYEDECGNIIEDQKHKRICFSKSIGCAFLGISFDGYPQDLYVHIPYNPNIKYKVPTEEQVPDADFTREVWVTRPIKMKCIGKIHIYYNTQNMTWRDYRPKVRYKYIEKY